MTTPLELTKAFHTSKMQVYMGDSRVPYVGEVMVPEIVHPTDEFDNTSTGGPLELADPFRMSPDGDGEVKFEGFDAVSVKKMLDASSLHSMKIPMAVNSLNPQLGKFLAMPMVYTIGAQFHGVNFGTLKAGTKREITAKYKMTTLKIEQNFIPILELDFVNAVYKLDGEDILGAVAAIL